jgi:hypothetical protein
VGSEVHFPQKKAQLETEDNKAEEVRQRTKVVIYGQKIEVFSSIVTFFWLTENNSSFGMLSRDATFGPAQQLPASRIPR